jgi:hypothetical protein
MNQQAPRSITESMNLTSMFDCKINRSGKINEDRSIIDFATEAIVHAKVGQIGNFSLTVM